MVDYINHFSLTIFYYFFGKALNYAVSLGSGVVVRLCTRMPARKGYDNHHQL